MTLKRKESGSLLPPQPRGPLHRRPPPLVVTPLGVFGVLFFSPKDRSQQNHAKQAQRRDHELLRGRGGPPPTGSKQRPGSEVRGQTRGHMNTLDSLEIHSEKKPAVTDPSRSTQGPMTRYNYILFHFQLERRGRRRRRSIYLLCGTGHLE